MQTNRTHGSHTAEVTLCGLAVYSSDFVPLGRVADVEATTPAAPETIAGRWITVEPNPTVRSVLDGADLVVSESMIFHAAPAEDRVILNLPARRLIRTARRTRKQVPAVAD